MIWWIGSGNWLSFVDKMLQTVEIVWSQFDRDTTPIHIFKDNRITIQKNLNVKWSSIRINLRILLMKLTELNLSGF